MGGWGLDPLLGISPKIGKIKQPDGDYFAIIVFNKRFHAFD